MRIVHSYTDLATGQWIRGNLHAHTTRSDGKRPAQEVIDDYAARGHGFLMLSDHDVHTSPEDYAALDSRGMVLIPGNEISADGVHILHVDADRRVEPDPDRQKVIDAINGSAGFAIVNHPNWFADWDHCPQEKLDAWQGYAGIEIYNGVIGRLAGSPYATDRWDRLLSKGRRVWGYANDDSHAVGDVELGWAVVHVPRPSVREIVDALARGRFYASTGVRLTNIRVDGTRVRIETENAARIVACTLHQKRFAVVDDSFIDVDLSEYPAIERYVRFECYGSGEQMAWTQPFWIEK